MNIKFRQNLYFKSQKSTLIFLLCISVRLILFISIRPWEPQFQNNILLTSDGLGYHELAVNILNNFQFGYNTVSSKKLESHNTLLYDDIWKAAKSGYNTGHDALRTPMYPIIISLLYLIFGLNPWIILLLQIIIDGLTCVILGKMIQSLSDVRVALISQIFYCIDPHLVLYSSSKFMSETLFVFLIVTSIYFLVKFVLSHESYFIKYYIVFCGLLLGLATLTRPIAFYISLIFMFIIYYKNRRGAGLIYALFFLFVFFVTISPWIMRNYYVFNSFSLSTVGYYNLLVLNVSQLEYSKNRKELSEIQKELLLQSDSLMLKDGKNPLELNQFMKSYYWKRLALSKIFQNPIEYFILSMKGSIFTLFNIGTSDFNHVLGLSSDIIDVKKDNDLIKSIKHYLLDKNIFTIFYGAIFFAYLIITYFFVIIGVKKIYQMHSNQERILFLFFGLLAIYFIVAVGSAGIARFKIPSIPFYLPFIGIGIQSMLKKRYEIKLLNKGLS